MPSVFLMKCILGLSFLLGLTPTSAIWSNGNTPKFCRNRGGVSFWAENMQYHWYEAKQDQGYYDGLIGSRICAFDWYQNQWPWMTLNGKYALSQKRCFTEPTRKKLNKNRPTLSTARNVGSDGVPIRQSRQLPIARHGAPVRRPVRPPSLLFQTLFQSLWKEKRENMFYQNVFSIFSSILSIQCFVMVYYKFGVLVFVKQHSTALYYISSNIRYIRIFAGVPRWGQTTAGLSTNGTAFCFCTLLTCYYSFVYRLLLS